MIRFAGLLFFARHAVSGSPSERDRRAFTSAYSNGSVADAVSHYRPQGGDAQYLQPAFDDICHFLSFGYVSGGANDLYSKRCMGNFHFYVWCKAWNPFVEDWWSIRKDLIPCPDNTMCINVVETSRDSLDFYVVDVEPEEYPQTEFVTTVKCVEGLEEDDNMITKQNPRGRPGSSAAKLAPKGSSGVDISIWVSGDTKDSPFDASVHYGADGVTTQTIGQKQFIGDIAEGTSHLYQMNYEIPQNATKPVFQTRVTPHGNVKNTMLVHSGFAFLKKFKKKWEDAD